MFVNGEFVSEKAVEKADEKPGTEIRLASWRTAGWDFIGIIDEVGVFNTPLPEDDLNDIMNNGLAEALSVSPIEKIATTWARMKEPYQ